MTSSEKSLAGRRCKPCEGGVSPLSPEQSREYLKALKGWTLAPDGMMIERDYVLRDFRAMIKLVNQIAEIAEGDNHHPDLHLTGYRKLHIELKTHAIGGLSENDFIVAAKIDRLPKDLKPVGK